MWTKPRCYKAPAGKRGNLAFFEAQTNGGYGCRGLAGKVIVDFVDGPLPVFPAGPQRGGGAHAIGEQLCLRAKFSDALCIGKRCTGVSGLCQILSIMCACLACEGARAPRAASGVLLELSSGGPQQTLSRRRQPASCCVSQCSMFVCRFPWAGCMAAGRSLTRR